ncbi:hypothetical protein HZI73_04405 [Vallitalea pronyensis]|uniref:Uncharacterized protein n=1 Tax=Vallitalea pronyensis TaxID=1348613 RepID=A0A8J8MI00_9FIRM|nr:hypothetical protein [Vallitalea pronyensis]QUI21578.1 hypothetical protein HZI73_04405 [Vallitalea pronyensis]
MKIIRKLLIVALSMAIFTTSMPAMASVSSEKQHVSYSSSRSCSEGNHSWRISKVTTIDPEFKFEVGIKYYREKYTHYTHKTCRVCSEFRSIEEGVTYSDWVPMY